MVEALRARGFEVVSLDDRIAFRFFYESRYRSRRDRGDLPDVVAVFTTREAHEHAVPYDVWRAGRKLSFSLGDLFPRLSWPVVSTLDRSDLDALYAAQSPGAAPRGRSASRRRGGFALRHVFGIAPETIRQASEPAPRPAAPPLPPTAAAVAPGASSRRVAPAEARVQAVAPGADRSRPRRVLRVPAGTVADLPGPPDVGDGRGARDAGRATRRRSPARPSCRSTIRTCGSTSTTSSWKARCGRWRIRGGGRSPSRGRGPASRSTRGPTGGAGSTGC